MRATGAGSQPDMDELIHMTTFMFIAGQDTSAKFLGNVIRYLCDVPGLQRQIRDDRSLIPAVVEEVLSLEGIDQSDSKGGHP